MRETTFAAIGVKPLAVSITRRKTVTECVEVKRLDREATKCFTRPECSCKENCASCPYRKYTSDYVTRRRNETAVYGKGQILSRFSLLVLIYVHFLDPDQNGYVRSINIARAARMIGCGKKTVMKCLHMLHEAGRLIVSQTQDPGIMQAFIPDYSTYFAPASRGGRGYVRLSWRAFEKFAALKDVNSLRLAIRAVLDASEGKRGFAAERSLKDARSDLPRYVTKKAVSEKLMSKEFLEAFDVSIEDGYVIVRIRPEIETERLCAQAKQECMEELADFEESVTAARKKRSRKIHTLSDNDKKDISNICLKYPVPVIIAAVQKFYETYLKPGLSYDSAGALIRTYASAMFSRLPAAA